MFVVSTRVGAAAGLLAGCLVVSTATAEAATILAATLTNDQEVTALPVVPTTDAGALRTSFGSAVLVLSDDQTALTYDVTVHGIDVTGLQSSDSNDNLRSAHIHSAPAGVNGSVIFGFVFPFSDINPDDLVITPFASGVGGTITGKWDLAEGLNTTLTDQLPSILAGLTYINIHTNQYPGGEIRGQVRVAPEPSLMVLLTLGGVAALTGRRPSRLPR